MLFRICEVRRSELLPTLLHNFQLNLWWGQLFSAFKSNVEIFVDYWAIGWRGRTMQHVIEVTAVANGLHADFTEVLKIPVTLFLCGWRERLCCQVSKLSVNDRWGGNQDAEIKFEQNRLRTGIGSRRQSLDHSLVPSFFGVQYVRVSKVSW